MTIKTFMAIMAERDAAIRERNMALEERKRAFAERDMAMLQRDTALSERNSAIQERNDAISTLRYRGSSMNDSNNMTTIDLPGGNGAKQEHDDHHQMNHMFDLAEVKYNQREVNRSEGFHHLTEAPTETPKLRKVKRAKENKPSSTKSAKIPRIVAKGSERFTKQVIYDIQLWKTS